MNYIINTFSNQIYPNIDNTYYIDINFKSFSDNFICKYIIYIKEKVYSNYYFIFIKIEFRF
jgi:hypothetical protein